MSDNELVERVKVIIADQCGCARVCENTPADGCACQDDARAALAAARPVIRAEALEEAAKVAQSSQLPTYLTEEEAITWCSASEHIAEDIRALLSNPPA